MHVCATLITPFGACGTNSRNTHFLCQISNLVGVEYIFWSDTKFMNTCSFTTHFKNICAHFNVFVECMICFDELKEASTSSFQLTPLSPKASPTTKKLTRACTWRFMTLWSSKTPYLVGTLISWCK